MTDTLFGLAILVVAILFYYGIYRLIRFVLKGGLGFTRPSVKPDGEVKSKPTKAATHLALLFGRHIVGMGLFALLNPLIYASTDGVTWWLSIWLGSIAFALVAYGFYALFFTNSAKTAWPGNFFTLAWVFVVLITLGPYIDQFNKRQSASASPTSQAQTHTQATDDWWSQDPRVVPERTNR